MKNRLIFFFAFALAMATIASCTEQQTQSVQTSNKVVQNVGEASAGQLDWCDDLIEDYVARSTDELMVLERKDTSVHFGWYLDRIENEFGKKYMIFHLGHEVSDEGNTNVRFVTNGWLYVDSLARKLYVYDFATDTIILWR
ncbi:MAG: hypothetical protein RLZZ91_894 [Bacteroidota bacterium]|jgi:hypothetical protein